MTVDRFSGFLTDGKSAVDCRSTGIVFSQRFFSGAGASSAYISTDTGGNSWRFEDSRRPPHENRNPSFGKKAALTRRCPGDSCQRAPTVVAAAGVALVPASTIRRPFRGVDIRRLLDSARQLSDSGIITAGLSWVWQSQGKHISLSPCCYIRPISLPPWTCQTWLKPGVDRSGCRLNCSTTPTPITRTFPTVPMGHSQTSGLGP